jgi:lipopolysaccharide transport protein LptA
VSANTAPSYPSESAKPTFGDRLKGFAQATRERLESLPRTEQSLGTPQQHALPAKQRDGDEAKIASSSASGARSKAGPDLSELKSTAKPQRQAVAKPSPSRTRNENRSEIAKVSSAVAEVPGGNAAAALTQTIAKAAPELTSKLSKAAAAGGDGSDLIDLNAGDLEPVKHQVKETAGRLVAKAQKSIDKKKLDPTLAPGENPAVASAALELPAALERSAAPEPSATPDLPEAPAQLVGADEPSADAGAIQPMGMSFFERLALSTIIASESHFAELGENAGEPATKLVSTIATGAEVEAVELPEVIEIPDAVKHVSNGAPTSDINPGLDEMVISSTNQTDFDLNDSEMTFSGNVQVKSPRFNLRADKFIVHLKGDRSGMSFGEAIGDVVIDLREAGQPTGYTGLADNAIYDPGEGKITLSGWPKIRQQFKEHVAITRDTQMVLYTDGRVKTLGRNRTLIRK